MFDLNQLEMQAEMQELKELGLDPEEIQGYICFFWIEFEESEVADVVN
jgi:hypothetical protein